MNYGLKFGYLFLSILNIYIRFNKLIFEKLEGVFLDINEWSFDEILI